MYDTSSNTQSAPEQDSGSNSGNIEARRKRESVLKDEKAGAQKALRSRAKTAKEKIIARRTQKELQDMQEIRSFWEDIFGKGAVASFFISISSFLSGEEGTFDAKAFDQEITKKANELAKKGFNKEEFVVAHRALGYGRNRENSEAALKAALEGGEKQIEVDIRKGPDGKLYLSHGKIKNKKETEKLLSFEKALEIIAENGNQNVAFFFDVKEPGLIKKIDAAIKNIDTINKHREGYRQIQKRHFILTFDRGILREAKESGIDRPLIYYYFPTKKYGILGKIVSMLGIKKIKNILGKVDSVTGSSLSENLNETGLIVNGKQVGKKHKKSFHLWEDLPSKDIMRTIKNSNGYLCIPAPLATKELVKEIKAKGIKVAVWGAENGKIKKMIHELGVDLVISDTPDYIKKAN